MRETKRPKKKKKRKNRSLKDKKKRGEKKKEDQKNLVSSAHEVPEKVVEILPGKNTHQKDPKEGDRSDFWRMKKMKKAPQT